MLAKVPPVTQSSYRAAVAATVNSIKQKHSLSDADLAGMIGCSAATVNNASNKNCDLGPLTLLRMAERFGINELGGVLSLVNAKVAPVDAVCTSDVATMHLKVAETVPNLIAVLVDNDLSDADVRKLDQLGTIDTLGQVADTLRWRRDGLRRRA